MFIEFNECEMASNGHLKVKRSELSKEPKLGTWVKWLSNGFSYNGWVSYKSISHIYIRMA